MLVAAVLLTVSLTVNSPGADGEAKQWAILIGVKNHDDSSLNLRYTDRDVKSLERVLVERAGLSVADGQILELSDLSAARLRPTKQNIEREVSALLEKVGPDDRLVVFYSGHATLVDGALYLVPADFQRTNATETGISARWLHDALRDCRAGSKFLILDSCHAGGARGVSADLDASQIAKAVDVEDVHGCVVLASSRSNEQSWEWTERRNGVFTYWLCRALEGGADSNGDGAVTSDEVYSYTHDRVRTTVQQVFEQDQTPVRLISEDVDGDPSLLSLRPEPPESVCRRLAEHLDLEIRFRKLQKVSVLEFLMPIGSQAGGLSQANLPPYCSSEVRDALKELAGDAYKVLDEEETLAAAKGVRIEDIGDPVSMRRLSEQSGGVDGVVTGDLRRRGRILRVQCELVATQDGETLAEPTAVLPLSEDLIADGGASFDNRQRPTGDAYDDNVVAFVSEATHLSHPLLQNGYPFEVAVWAVEATANDTITSRTPRHKKELVKLETEDRSELLLPARDGEIFEITIRSEYKNPVTVAVLVDGINVLGQQRERLANARRWHQRPNQTFRYEGWYLPKPGGATSGAESFERRRFMFTSLSDSVAGRQEYTDSLGLITIAFYDADGRSPINGDTLAVGEAQSDDQTLSTVPFRPGRMLGAIQIRYVDERLLK